LTSDGRGLLARARALLRPVREEALLLLALLLAAAAVGHSASALQGLARSDAWMWMTMLLLQALPYAAALLCAGLAAWPERALSVADIATPAEPSAAAPSPNPPPTQAAPRPA
jgi:hypothetical protein